MIYRQSNAFYLHSPCHQRFAGAIIGVAPSKKKLGAVVALIFDEIENITRHNMTVSIKAELKRYALDVEIRSRKTFYKPRTENCITTLRHVDVYIESQKCKECKARHDSPIPFFSTIPPCGKCENQAFINTLADRVKSVLRT
ncbi:MAG: hypothetical protein FWF97_04910 [Alphaproteobacteria bacterium]|nr:hypothetical protein [Alphaproteobacteria bacterium]